MDNGNSKSRSAKKKAKKAPKPRDLQKLYEEGVLTPAEKYILEVADTKGCVLNALFGKGKLDLYVRYDDLFAVCLVYVYCDTPTARKIHEAIYGKDGEQEEAVGLASRGFYKSLMPVATIWLNAIQKKENTIPTLVHELSHTADMVLEHAQVDDKSGEVKAYFMEREMRYILPKLYGIESKFIGACDELEKDIREAVKPLADKSEDSGKAQTKQTEPGTQRVQKSRKGTKQQKSRARKERKG